ncbi:MAG: TraR/DksA family transcriptional regulator [Candidatus Paceibacterota bacterium]
MNNKDLQRYKTKLLDMRNRLTGEIGHMSETVVTDARAVGEHDRAVSETVDKEVVLENTEEMIRRQVQDALLRIEAGSYGVCQECGNPIAIPRLDAVPYTAYCINCERTQEAE